MPKLEHICSWCGELISTEEREDIQTDTETHTMCEKCELKQLEERTIPTMEEKLLKFKEKGPEELANKIESRLAENKARAEELRKILSEKEEGEAPEEEYTEIEKALADDSLSPIALMRLTEIKDPDELLKDHDRDDVVVEEKLDGWKTQAIKKGGEVSVYSRRGEDKTANFPDIVKALSGLPDGTLVEGELVYWHNGKQDVGKVTSLAGSKPETSLEKAKELPGTMKMHLYDILWHKGNNVSKEPFSKRRQTLQSAVKTGDKIQLTKQYPFSDWQKAMNAAVKSGGEGIVLKIKDEGYQYKSKGQQEPKPKGIMYKYKGGAGKSDSDDYVVYDYEVSDKGKLKAFFGQYHNGKLYHISEISNFSEENEELIKSKLKKGKFVIEIGFQERQPGGLRHQKFERFRDDKQPKDATMNEFHVENIDEFKLADKKASLSKTASYADEWIRILDRALGRAYTPGRLPRMAGVNFPAIYYLVSRLESNNRNDVIGDAGNSFGRTQVHGPYFMRYLARDPRTQALTGMSPEELRGMAASWMRAKKAIKGVWKRVPVDQDMARRYMSNKSLVLRRKEGVTIKKSPTDEPGIIKKRGDRFVGYVIDLNKLRRSGLDITNASLNRLHQICRTFITWGVANSAISRLFIGQDHPAAYAKFNRTINSRNIRRSPGLQAVLDNVSQRDFMNKVRIVVSDVKKYGYDTMAPGAYNIYQLIFTANSSGAGRVRQFLKNRKLFAAGNVHYIQSSRFKRAMRWIQRDPKMPPDVQQIARSLLKGLPPAGGVAGFTSAPKSTRWGEFSFSKRAMEIVADDQDDDPMYFDDEVTQPGKSWAVIEMEQRILGGLQRLMNQSETVMYRVWNTFTEHTGKKDLGAEEIVQLYRDDVTKYVIANMAEMEMKAEQNPNYDPLEDYMLKNWHIKLKTPSEPLPEEEEEEEGEFFEETTPTQPDLPWHPGILNVHNQWVQEFAMLMKEPQWARVMMQKIAETLASETGKMPGSRKELLDSVSRDMSNYIRDNWETMQYKKLEYFSKHMKEPEDPNRFAFVDYLKERWGITPEFFKSSLKNFLLSKRADYVEPSTMYFPGQYADAIKSGKRRMTIRPNDVPVRLEEVVRCMTYSGGVICDVKIMAKNVMSVNRIGKAYGDRMAKSLAQKFGPKKRFVVIKFDPVDNINAADDDDDDEKKMSEVLIDKDKKLTRGQIKAHYSKPAIRKKIMSRIKDKPVIVYIGTGTNEKILKRNHDGKEIVITNDDPKNDENPNNYFYWVKRRVLSFHQVFGTKTNLGFVDLDIHGDFSLSKAKEYANAVSKAVKDKYGVGTTTFQSGGSGLHVEFKLGSEMSIDKLRGELKEMLTTLNEDWEGVTTGVVKGSGMRSDISTLHNKGSIRVPGSYGESHGNIKKSVGSEQDTLENNYNSGGFGKLYTRPMEEPFPDPLMEVAPMQGREPVSQYISYNTSDDGKFALSKRHMKKRAGHTYSDSDGEYSVDMLIEITAKNKVESVPLGTLEWNMKEKIWGPKSGEHSPEDVLGNPKKYSEDNEKIKKAELKYPILVYKGEVIDGYHRLAKAVKEKKKSIKARVVTDKQMDAARIDEERIKELSKSAARKKKILMLVAKDDFYEPEYFIPRRIFTEKYGFDVSVTSSDSHAFGTQGTEIVATPMDDVNPVDYDSFFVVGGEGMIEFSKNEDAQKLLKSFVRQKKPVAMICHGPLLAAEAGVIRGREITGWPDIVGKIRRAKGTWTGMPLERDGSLFTAIGPEDAENLAYVLASFLNGEKTLVPAKDKLLNWKNASQVLNNIWKFAADLSEEEELRRLMEEQQEEMEEEEEGEAVPEEVELFQRQRREEVIRRKEEERKRIEEEQRVTKQKRREFPELYEGEEEMEIPEEPVKTDKPKALRFKDIVQLEEEEEEAEEEEKETVEEEESLETSEEFEQMVSSVKEELSTMLEDIGDFGDDWGAAEPEEDEEEDYETTMEKAPETIFGVKLEAPRDESGEVLDRWFKKGEIPVPEMSAEAKELFTLKNMRDGASLNKLFQDPLTWEVIDREPQLLQKWVLPAIIMGIGQRWFTNNGSRITLGTRKFKNVGKTPFGMFDEDDIALLKKGAALEDLPSAKKYIRMINQLVTKYANYYFSYGYRKSKRNPQGALPMSGYIYKALSRAMTKEIAEVKGYKEVRFPVCSVCKAKQKNERMVIHSMAKVADNPARWECETCKMEYEKNRDIEVPGIERELEVANKTISSAEARLGRFSVALEDVDDEAAKERVRKKIDEETSKIESNKMSVAMLSQRKDNLMKTQRVLGGQLSVPYWHAWCPNPTCPGRKVPLTAINWDAEVWKKDDEGELAAKLYERFGIKRPDVQEADVEPTEAKPVGRKVSSAHIPPEWLMDVEFVCPHDGVAFTLRDSKYKGHRNLGGFLWEPFRRIEWDTIHEAAPKETDVVVPIAGAEEKMDAKLSKALFIYLSLLGKTILSRDKSTQEEEFQKWVEWMLSRHKSDFERVKKAKGFRTKLRENSLYDTVEEISDIDPLSFVAWLTETAVSSKYVQDDEKDIGEENFITKTTRAQRRDEIYIPILQNWVDRMMAKENGFEHFGIEDILTNAKQDGIPSDGPGTFFIAKVGDNVVPLSAGQGKQEGAFGFRCNLRLKAKFTADPIHRVPEARGEEGFEEELLDEIEAKKLIPVRGAESSLYPRILRVIGMWQLSQDQVDAVLEDKGGNGKQRLDGELPVSTGAGKLGAYALKNPDENIVGDMVGHDFQVATLNKDETELAVGDYILVQALLMPGAYKWGPINMVQGLRRKSDTAKNIFGRLGALMSDEVSETEDRRLLQEFVRDVREYGDDPKEMEMIVEDLIDRFEAERKKTSSWKLSVREAKDPLSKYKQKREFNETPEPEGEVAKGNKHRFVIQRHKAEKAGEHFDLRLENEDGALSSWSIPKHKLPKGKEKLLAIKTEDHPISYTKFKGEIPSGYGAGKMDIHDSGTYEEIEWSGSKIIFRLKGGKEKGTYKIFKTSGKNWMIMEHNKEDKRAFFSLSARASY